MVAPHAEALVRLLGNPTSRAVLVALEDGPSYPRELAARLHVTEGQVQKALRQLGQHGLVAGRWHHDGKTVKRYELAAHAVRFAFHDGAIHSTLE